MQHAGNHIKGEDVKGFCRWSQGPCRHRQPTSFALGLRLGVGAGRRAVLGFLIWRTNTTNNPTMRRASRAMPHAAAGGDGGKDFPHFFSRAPIQ
jgi:hypothetical protein